MSFDYNPFTGNLDSIGPGGGATSPWQTIGFVAPGSSTSVVDSLANNSFQTIKYIIGFFNESLDSYKTVELSVLNNDGNYLESRSNRLGAGLDARIVTNNNAGTFELQIQNNETFDVSVTLARLALA